MSHPANGCAEPFGLVEGDSPFSRMLVLGYYDGPTSGVVESAVSRRVYRFDMLDWDDEHRVRVFRLAELPATAMDECVRALAPQEPRCPVWVPGPAASSSQQGSDVRDPIEPILAQAAPASLLVAWIGFGEDVLAARKAPPVALTASDWFSAESPSAPDWFALLGLSRDALLGQEA